MSGEGRICKRCRTRLELPTLLRRIVDASDLSKHVEIEHLADIADPILKQANALAWRIGFISATAEQAVAQSAGFCSPHCERLGASKAS